MCIKCCGEISRPRRSPHFAFILFLFIFTRSANSIKTVRLPLWPNFAFSCTHFCSTASISSAKLILGRLFFHRAFASGTAAERFVLVTTCHGLNNWPISCNLFTLITLLIYAWAYIEVLIQKRASVNQYLFKFQLK